MKLINVCVPFCARLLFNIPNNPNRLFCVPGLKRAPIVQQKTGEPAEKEDNRRLTFLIKTLTFVWLQSNLVIHNF